MGAFDYIPNISMFQGVPGNSDILQQILPRKCKCERSPSETRKLFSKQQVAGLGKERNAQTFVSPVKRRLERNKSVMCARAVTT